MALTLEAEQRLEDVGVIAFYRQSEAEWLGVCRATKAFVKGNFPDGSPIRRDDVAKALIPILEVHEGYKEFRNEEKLIGKFWIKYFADLLIDQSWDKLIREEQDGKDGTKSKSQ